jgi:uncharacterized protein involved in exopolysaccharide biosynthesis/Mrp family chromosome partitioning ATPase
MRNSGSNYDSPEYDAPTTSGLQIGDVYYILFRHKWKILICAVAGLLAAGVMYKLKTPLFVSEAKLLVRYVMEVKSFGPSSGGDYKNPDAMGTSIMNSEMEILQSFDLAKEVAAAVGPAKILGMTNGSPSPESAAFQIQGGLNVGTPGHGNVIVVTFSHPDAETTQVVLKQLIDSYFKKHAAIHSAFGVVDEALTKKVDDLRQKIAETEERLRNKKSSAKVVSIEDTMKSHLDLMKGIRSELFQARAELAEKSASLFRITNSMAAILATNAQPSTNPVAMVPTPAKLDEYRRLVGQLEWFIKREQELTLTLTSSNNLVRDIQKGILEKQREKVRMELEDPSLVRIPVTPSGVIGTPDPAGALYYSTSSRVIELHAKIAELTNQWAAVQQEAARVEAVENEIRELQRQKEVLEVQYKSYATGLEQSRVNDSVGPGKLPNIAPIQEPTPPGKDFTKLKKKVGMIAAGGLGAGIALAFLIELFLDQTIRRAKEIQRKMRLPVFLSIPHLNKLRTNGSLGSQERKALPGPEPNGSLLPALHSISATRPIVQPYCDALRDRLIHYFQKNNMTHKPKLVAVTGCGDGSGVSTMAAGLAASLSETGDGNVLLVDTNVTEGAAHPFYRGKLACGLNDVLQEDRRGGAQIQDNLYVATASESDGGLIKALPKRFSQLVPRLKASDYDYIIFDMPPVTQTSITSKLAGFMDMVLLVVESEKTGQSILSEAADLLRDSRANVATVLNKTRRYVPQWIHREFE